jgi:hypothetical protein
VTKIGVAAKVGVVAKIGVAAYRWNVEMAWLIDAT